MSIKHEFDRMNHLFKGGVEQTRKQANKGAKHWADEGDRQGRRLAKKVRREVDTRSGQVSGMEDAFLKHARENPALYILAAALLIGALIAKLVMEAREDDRQLPLL